MKKLTSFLCIITCLWTTSCKKTEPVYFDFDSQSFSLLKTVAETNQNKTFEYGTYDGFRGQTTNYRTLLLLKNSPVWSGHDNIGEDFYNKHKVVGVTFHAKDPNANQDSLKISLQHQYKSLFNLVPNQQYSILKTDGNLVLTIQFDSSWNRLTFFSGLSDSLILTYMNPTFILDKYL